MLKKRRFLGMGWLAVGNVRVLPYRVVEGDRPDAVRRERADAASQTSRVRPVAINKRLNRTSLLSLA